MEHENSDNDERKQPSIPASEREGRKRPLHVTSPSGDHNRKRETTFANKPSIDRAQSIEQDDYDEMTLAQLRQRELEYELQWLRLRRQRFANEAQLLALQQALRDVSSTSSTTDSFLYSRDSRPAPYRSSQGDSLPYPLDTPRALAVSDSLAGGALRSSIALRELEQQRRLGAGLSSSSRLQEDFRPDRLLQPRDDQSLEAALRREARERALLLDSSSAVAMGLRDETGTMMQRPMSSQWSRARELLESTPRRTEAAGSEISSVERRLTAQGSTTTGQTNQPQLPTLESNAVLPQLLAIPADSQMLSPYQQLVRQSLEFFQLEVGDMERSDSNQVQGLVAGQVGVRCRYCAHRPLHWRGRGSFSFPNRLSRVYQAAQNVANNHLRTVCPEIPESVKRELESRHLEVAPMRGGGKKYWEEACKSIGLYERENESGVWLYAPERQEQAHKFASKLQSSNATKPYPDEE